VDSCLGAFWGPQCSSLAQGAKNHARGVELMLDPASLALRVTRDTRFKFHILTSAHGLTPPPQPHTDRFSKLQGKCCPCQSPEEAFILPRWAGSPDTAPKGALVATNHPSGKSQDLSLPFSLPPPPNTST
jgi:hypothetical protein